MAEFSPITQLFNANSQASSTFKPMFNRSFNVSLVGTWVGTVALQRQFNNDAVGASSAVVTANGTSYAPADTITPATAGGTVITNALYTIATTTLVVVPAVATGGANYVVGNTITLQNGAVLTVATLSGSAVATVTLTNGGSFAANITTAGGLTQQSTSGSGSGATFTATLAKYGANTVNVTTAGIFTSASTTPTNPVAQSATSGSGTGATLTVTYTPIWHTVQTWTANTESQVTEVEDGAIYQIATTAWTSGTAFARLGQAF